MPNATALRSPAVVDRLTKVARALGDGTRILLVQQLAQSAELCVCDISEALELPQPLLSHHLKVLREAGLVRDRRQGRWAYYALDRDAFAAYGVEIAALLEISSSHRKIGGVAKRRRCD